MEEQHQGKNEQSQESDDIEREEDEVSLGLQYNYAIIVEIVKRLDEDSLGNAACVSRLWREACAHEGLWEALCSRRLALARAHHMNPLVLAMGGYKRFYLMCIKPIFGSNPGLAWTMEQVQLSLSLYSIHFYERLWRDPPASLSFLCKPKTGNGVHFIERLYRNRLASSS
ncbi:hypothetical protein AMTRI_Chr10g2970 [Amborella trichopoda]|uniref:F-box domain-containing protein n=1 Tax=Amborella trichopoda TaxID=13333 RepID=W1PKQ4_AMBTC|nr:hypothetical protein AMTR_s00028p00135480 [Amborella trichopoda]